MGVVLTSNRVSITEHVCVVFHSHTHRMSIYVAVVMGVVLTSNQVSITEHVCVVFHSHTHRMSILSTKKAN